MIFSFLFQEVNNFERPGLLVVGFDSDMLDISDEESEEMDVCALCDNGGDVIWYVITMCKIRIICFSIV